MVVASTAAYTRYHASSGIKIIVVQYCAGPVHEHGGRVQVIGDVILDVSRIRRRLRDIARQSLAEEDVERPIATGVVPR